MPKKAYAHRIADIRRAIELMETLGKTVVAIKLHPDGSFRLMTSDYVSRNSPTPTNPWDTVLAQ